jgi:hypothetical protein
LGNPAVNDVKVVRVAGADQFFLMFTINLILHDVFGATGMRRREHQIDLRSHETLPGKCQNYWTRLFGIGKFSLQKRQFF